MATRRPRSDSEEDDIPLHHKKPFGAGLKRKKIEFIRAQDKDEGITAARDGASKGTAIGDLYASVVLGAGRAKSSPAPDGAGAEPEKTDEERADTPVCSVCSLPITASLDEHNASLAHQVSLAHSHPPSALDRSRMGLRALKAHGWDPDARRGLGREGEGLRFPIKVSQKEDNLGIGAVLETKPPAEEKPKPRSLSAKERKALAQQEKTKAERLHREIYGRVDVERYLRGDGSDAS
jgi:hypothetical protein